MARRVFASRGSLLQRLCSKGQLSDLQADDSRLQTASPHVPSLASPRPPAQPAQPDQQQLAALAEEAPAEPALPQLRPIRTRVGQARSRAQASGSEVGSTAGGGTPASAQGSQG